MCPPDFGESLCPALSRALLFTLRLAVPPEGESLAEGHGPAISLGFPNTPPVEAPHPLRAGAPFKRWELVRALQCRVTQLKFLGWKVGSRRGEIVQRSRNGKEKEDCLLGGKVTSRSSVLGVNSSCPLGAEAAVREQGARGVAGHAVPYEAAPLAAPVTSCSHPGATA